MAEGAESYSVRRGGGLRTLCAHPAFSVLSAVAFAALLSGGSVLLTADLIARLLEGGGSAVAAAPLGFTARATLAIAGALAGIALGLSLSRRLALSLGVENSDRSGADAAPRYRPIDIAEDVGEEGIAPVEFADPGVSDPPVDTQPTVELTVPQPTPAAASEEAQHRPAEPSLGELGLMQLTARLAASLAERRKQRAANEPARPPAQPPSPGALGEFEPSGADEVARATADFFAPAPSPTAGLDRTSTLAVSDGRNSNL